MAGFGTILDKPIHDRYPGRIVNTHPALLPAFKGWHAVDDTLAAGVKVTGCTVHYATFEVDDGPILAQEAVPVLADDTTDDPARADQGRRAPPLPRGLCGSRSEAGGRAVDARAAVRLRQDGPRDFAAACTSWVGSWCRGAAPRAIAAAAVPVTTVEEVTGSPEMLDHRVVTLHPKIHGGILADRGLDSHLADLETHGIVPFDLVVSNLYPFADNPASRPSTSVARPWCAPPRRTTPRSAS